MKFKAWSPFGWSFAFLMTAFFWAPASGPWAADKLNFGLSPRTNPSYILPFWALEEKGAWKRHGLETNFVTFDAGAARVQGLAAGAIDMGVGGTLSEFQAIARGLPVKLVADFGSKQDYYVFVRMDSRIKSPADLKGARIGITRFGGTVHAYALALAKVLDLEGQIKMIASGGARQEIAAVLSGVSDGTIFSFYGMAPLKFRGEVREVVRVHDYLPKEWIDVAISARTDFIRKRPETIRRALVAVLEGTDSVMKNGDWTVAKLVKEFGYADRDARVVHRDHLRYARSGKIDRRAIENTMNFLIEYKLIPKEKVPAAEELYTNEFAS